MKPKTVVVLGMPGRLATALKASVFGRQKARGENWIFPTRDTFDCTNTASLLRLLGPYGQRGPDYIINAASKTDVDWCELPANRPEVYAVNALFPALLALTSEESRIIQISTDYVFGGDDCPPKGYREDCEIYTVNEYGWSKSEGETNCILALHDRSLIVRTSWLRGMMTHDKALLGTVDRLRRGERVLVDAVMTGSPTSAWDLAEAILRLMDCDPVWSDKGAHVVHYANSGPPATRYAMVKAVAETLGVQTNTLEPTEWKPSGGQAARPRASQLDSALYTSFTHDCPRSWADAFADAYAELVGVTH